MAMNEALVSERTRLEQQGHTIITLTDTEWIIVLKLHPRHLYAGAGITLRIKFVIGYPATAPQVQLLSPIHHPNFLPNGTAPAGLFESMWHACLGVYCYVYYLVKLLDKPTKDLAVLNHVASKELKSGVWKEKCLQYMIDEELWLVQNCQVATQASSGPKNDTPCQFSSSIDAAHLQRLFNTIVACLIKHRVDNRDLYACLRETGCCWWRSKVKVWLHRSHRLFSLQAGTDQPNFI